MDTLDIRDGIFSSIVTEGGVTPVTMQGGISLSLLNSTFAANRGGNGAALHVGPNCSATLDACVFANNTANSSDGFGAVWASGAARLTISNSLFDFNRAQAGGAVSANETSNIQLHNVTFTSNSASGNAGAVLLSLSNASLDSCTFFNNSMSGQHGGAIMIVRSMVTINQCRFDRNVAYVSDGYGGGGAISFATPADAMLEAAFLPEASSASRPSGLLISSTTFSANAVVNVLSSGLGYGGSLRAMRLPLLRLHNVTVTGSSVTGEESGGQGGAIFLTQCNTTITNSTFRQCLASRGHGGALMANAGSNYGSSSGPSDALDVPAITNITGCVFEHNTATLAQGGGALFLDSADTLQFARLPYQIRHLAWVQDCVFYNNSVTSQGGGAIAAVGKGTELTVMTSRLQNNSAGGFGGAISAVSCYSVRVIGCDIRNNSAMVGGGINANNNFLLQVVATRLVGNRAPLPGVTGSGITGAGAGMNIAALSTSFLPTQKPLDWPGTPSTSPSPPRLPPYPSLLPLSPGAVTSPASLSSASTPSVPSAEDALVHVRNTTFEFNTAMEGYATGAALSAANWPRLLVEDSLFRGNQALGAAALNVSSAFPSLNAVTTRRGVFVVLNNCTFQGNNATATLVRGQGGGAVNLASDGKAACYLSLLDSRFEGNSAFNGGAIYTQGLNVSLVASGCLFVNNTARSSDGAAGNGGSLCAEGIANISLTNTSFALSTAAAGGGLYVADTPGVRIISSSFTSNTATSTTASTIGGAGMAWNSFALTRSMLPANILILNSTFDSNVANSALGGGLALRTPPQAWLLAVEVRNSTFRHNRAGSGAGLYLSAAGATLSVSRSDVFNCTALSAPPAAGYGIGGALLVEAAATVALNATHILACTAARGGALAIRSVGSAHVVNCTLSGNHAVGSLPPVMPPNLDSLDGTGAGLWVSGQVQLVVNGSTFAGNQAGLLGGAMAILGPTCEATGQNQAPTSSTAPCSRPVVVSSVIRNNVAGDSGGGIFSPYAFRLTNCSDLGGAANQPAAASSTFHSVCDDLNNTALLGFGPTLATSPVSMMLDDVASRASSVFWTTHPSYGSLRQSLVFPSNLTSNRELLQLVVWDSVNQSMTGPWLGLMYAVSVSRSPAGDASSPQLLGRNLVVYKEVANTSAFLIDAAVFGGQINRRYSLTFTLAAATEAGRQVQNLSLDAIVPPCMNGEAARDNGANTICERCIAGAFLFRELHNTSRHMEQDQPSCWVCPQDAVCPGGPVILPEAGYWHSHPQSTNMIQCLRDSACDRSDDRMSLLSQCKEAWFTQLHRDGYSGNSTSVQPQSLPASCVALGLSDAGNMPLLLQLRNNRTYTNLLCNDGYGGNLCGVCVPNEAGAQTGMQGNFACSTCPDKWRIIAVSVALFLANLLMVGIQVMFTMGEQLESCSLRSLESSNLFSLLITHMQYLVVIFKLNMQWPPAVVALNQVAVTFASISDQYTRATSISCLSDGSPEAQATYVMVWGLSAPAVLAVVSVSCWCSFWLFRHHHDKRRTAKQSNNTPTTPASNVAPSQGASATLDTAGAAKAHGTPTGLDPGQLQSSPFARLSQVSATPPDAVTPALPALPACRHSSLRIGEPQVMATLSGPPGPLQSVSSLPVGVGEITLITAGTQALDSVVNQQAGPAPILKPRANSMQTCTPPARSSTPNNAVSAAHADPRQSASGSSGVPASSGSASGTLTTGQSSGPSRQPSQRRTPTALASKPSAPGTSTLLTKRTISTVDSLRRRMPALDAREPTTWLSDEPLPGGEPGEEALDLGFFENMEVLDRFMTLWQQAVIVVLCTYFVVYQAWASAALTVFSCYFIDRGGVSSPQLPQPSFYADFQAAAADNGYWRLNLNQACYEGQHLSLWTPVGVVCSVLIACGLPLLQFLPVFLNRKRLHEPVVQFRYGMLYLSFFYQRVPYWGPARQLQLLVLIIVQTFSNSLESAVQQATIMLNVLLLFLIINLAVWPFVSPKVMLMDFLSTAALIATISLGVPFSTADRTTNTAYASACGSLILIFNILYLVALLVLCGRAFLATGRTKLQRLNEVVRRSLKTLRRHRRQRDSLPATSTGSQAGRV